MMIVMPVILLIVFGYAASFDVSTIPTVVAGPGASAAALRAPFVVVQRAPAEGATWARTELRDGKAAVAMVTGPKTVVFIDGSQLFAAKAALAALANARQQAGARGSAARGSAAQGAASAGTQAPQVTVLYDPSLKTADIMIPGLAGVILVFVGTMITSLGVVRERQTGTLEQLAVMPLRPRDVYLGKVVPYFAVAAVDLAIVLAVGVAVFGVPFRGSLGVFAFGALLFVFVTLGIGVLISSVSQNQGQAIQLSFMIMLPQVLLSGLIFPLSSIAVGVRWISYVLPLTYFNEIARGVMLRAEPIGPLWPPFVFLALLGVVVVILATLRFRTFLAPATPRRGRRVRPDPAAITSAAAETAASGGAR
jgi:ABC-2 type transport system permease protein